MTKHQNLFELSKITKKVDESGKKSITKEVSEKFRKLLFELDDEYEKLYKILSKKSLSILILGNRNSLFLKKLIRNFKLFLEDTIKIYIAGVEYKLGMSKLKNPPSNRHHTFEDLYISIPFGSTDGMLKVLRKLRNFYVLRKAISNTIQTLKPDVVNIHYLHYFWAFVNDRIRKCKVVTTIWGSDMYRSASNNGFIKKLHSIVLKDSKIITVGNGQLKKDFINIYGKKFENKIRIAAFGTPIDLLEHDVLSDSDIKKFKEKFNISSGKIIIIVGSSADEYEHHIEILDALKKFKKDIFVIVPMTYGNIDYMKKVEDHFNKLDIEGIIIKYFLTDTEMATLKKIADITIYLPETDAFSAFLLESLYAGSFVITGKWLPYTWIDEYGIYCRRIEKPDTETIFKELKETFENLEKDKKESSKNKEKILKLTAWQYRFKDWLKVYAEIL